MGSSQQLNADRPSRTQARLHRTGLPLAAGAGMAVGLFLGLAFWGAVDRTLLLVLGASTALLAQQAHRRIRRDAALKDAEALRFGAVLRSERQLNAAEHVAGMGSFDWYPATGELRWSDEHFRLWGLQPGSVTPTYDIFKQGIHPDDAAEQMAALQTALSGGRLYNCQHRVLRSDGSVRDLHGRGEVFFDERGQAVRMIGTVLDITDRLRQDESLRIVEFAMDAIADPVSVIDQDEVYRLVNSAWCRANLLTREQALGKSLDEVFPVIVSPARRQAVRDSIALGQELVVRSDSPSKGSPGRLIETRYFPFRHPQVTWHGTVMISRDVTDEAANQAALAASLDNLRLTLNATGDAIFASDAHALDEPVLFANERLLQLWDIPPGMADRVTAALIIEHARPHFVDPDREVARILEVIALGEPAEDRLQLRDGRVLVRRCIPTLAEGRQVRVWGFRDITVEARALRSLSDSESRQRAMLDAFPGFMASLNADLIYRYANDRMAWLHGRTPDQVIGQHACAVFGAERAAVIQEETRRTLAGERVVFERHFPATAARPALTVLITLAAGAGLDGEPLCYAFGTDITELKQTEAALLAAKDDAERANHAKSQFLSNMSHELRTPLNAVLGFGQLLQMNAPRNLNDKQLRQVREILNAGQHLLALINDLLDLARIEAGRMSLSLEPVALPTLVDECWQLMQPLAQKHAVVMVPVRPDDIDQVVMADRMKLKQVLLNLLSNAIKYNRPQGRVSLRCQTLEPGQLRLEVLDTGPGMDARAQARLFQAFERLDADRTQTEGTGIGLALSQRLVQLMDGEIGVDSQPGAGSRFWVRLALAPGSLPQACVDERLGATRPQAAARSTSATRILCIDDNPVNLALIEALLEGRPGMALMSSADPLQGLQLASTHRPDLVLLDIQLPGIDGLEVLRRLRADPPTAATPVIAVSADAMPEAVQRCLDAGFVDYITKPVDAQRLFSAIDAALDKTD